MGLGGVLIFFSDVHSAAPNPRSPLLSQQKRRVAKSKPTFSPEQLHVSSPPVLVLVRSTCVRRNKRSERQVWSQNCSGESGQLGFLAGAIPLPCPACVYLKHRDYSCSCCQQRASFRLSPLHPMTSAGPSHLQQKTHNEWESLLLICIRRNTQKQHTVIWNVCPNMRPYLRGKSALKSRFCRDDLEEVASVLCLPPSRHLCTSLKRAEFGKPLLDRPELGKGKERDLQ